MRSVGVLRFEIATEQIGVDGLILRHDFLPVRSVFKALSMHRRSGGADLLTIYADSDLGTAIRLGYRFRVGGIVPIRRIDPGISGDVPQGVGCACQFPVAVRTGSCDFSIISALDGNGRLIAQSIITVKRGNAVSYGMAYPLKFIISIGGRNTIPVGFF